MDKKISDTTAMGLIQRELESGEWCPETTQSISDIVELTGRGITEMDDQIHTREALIELLTKDWIRSVQDNQEWVWSFLAIGHKGYDNMSYSELLKEAQDAELIDEEG